MTTLLVAGDNPTDVIPALVAGIQSSANALDHRGLHTWQRVVEVYPMRVDLFDQIDLPRARPLLHGLLALDGLTDGRKLLKPDESMRLTGGNVNPIAAHDRSCNLTTEYGARWIPGTSPGMTLLITLRVALLR